MTNFKFVGNGLFLGPQPAAQDLEAAKQQGVRTVIDFRLPGENGDIEQRFGKSMRPELRVDTGG